MGTRKTTKNKKGVARRKSKKSTSKKNSKARISPSAGVRQQISPANKPVAQILKPVKDQQQPVVHKTGGKRFFSGSDTNPLPPVKRARTGNSRRIVRSVRP